EGGDDFDDEEGGEEGEEVNFNRADGAPAHASSGERRPGGGGGGGGQRRRRGRGRRGPGGGGRGPGGGGGSRGPQENEAIRTEKGLCARTALLIVPFVPIELSS